MKENIKKLYKIDSKLAIQVAKALGYKIVSKNDDIELWKKRAKDWEKKHRELSVLKDKIATENKRLYKEIDRLERELKNAKKSK